MQIYESVCQEVGGRHFPKLYQNYKVKVPVLTGIFRPQIYLPVPEWPKQQLSIILTHELYHYRQKDIWLKRVATLLLAAQWVNPAVWIFYKTIVLWSEYACDWLSYPQCGGKRAYFQTIISIAEKRGQMRSLGISALFTDSCELERRVQHAQWCGKKRNGKPWVSALLAAAIAAAGLAATYYTSTIALEKTYQLYLATEKRTELPPAPQPTEYHDSGPSGNIHIKTGVTHDAKNDSPLSQKNFEWNLGGHTMLQTSKTNVDTKQFLTIFANLQPHRKNIKAGFMDMDGNRCFINMDEDIIYMFQIPQDGTYRVFIENTGSHPVEICGFYSFD